MKTVMWELKKNPIRPAVLFVLTVAALILNFAVAKYWFGRSAASTTDGYKRGYDEVYGRVEGRITLENMEWIASEKKRLDKAVADGGFSTEEDPDGTYTGYVFSDSELFDCLYADAKYAYEYASFAKNVSEKADDAAELYEEKGSPSLSRRYREMSESFRGRRITSFYRTDGWRDYFSYEFSDLLVIFLITAGISALFSQEKETGMDMLLKLSRKGRLRAPAAKIATAMFLTFIISALFSAEDFIFYAVSFGLRGFSNPVYSLPEFKTSVLTVSIGGYVLINYFFRLIGFLTFASLVMLVSGEAGGNLLAFGCGAAVFVGSIVIYAVCPSASFLPLLNSIKICSGFDMTNIFGVFLPRLICAAAVQLFIFAVCVSLVFARHTERAIKREGKGKEAKTDALRSEMGAI